MLAVRCNRAPPRSESDALTEHVEPLAELIAEAVLLGGGEVCATGRHVWITTGGRPCPWNAEECSQAVYRCKFCGTYDYGEPGGPGHEDCKHGACSDEAAGIAGAVQA